MAVDVREIPPLLQADLDSGALSLCVLVRITPRRPGYEALCVTSLDRDIEFDLGDGPALFHAAVGVELSNRRSTSTMGVDNAEMTSLMPTFDVPIAEEDLRAGVFDEASWTAYVVNYMAPDHGRAHWGSGQLGKVNILDGRTFVAEMLGLTSKLQQSIIERDSRYCRAIYGSQPLGTVGALVTERYPCMKDTSGSWVEGEVTNPGETPNHTFQTNLVGAAGTYRPAMIEWLEGSANAGRFSPVEDHLADGVLVLKFETMLPPADGDAFRISVGCTSMLEGVNGCKHHHGPQAVLWFRGEPRMPVGRSERLNTPGVIA